LKKLNDDLKKKIKMLEQRNDQMSLKIEQSFSSNPNPKLAEQMSKNMQGSQPGTTMASMNING
jgi:hypothetical protein